MYMHILLFEKIFRKQICFKCKSDEFIFGVCMFVYNEMMSVLSSCELCVLSVLSMSKLIKNIARYVKYDNNIFASHAKPESNQST